MKQKKMAETVVAVKAGNVQDMDVVNVLGTAKLQFCSGTCRYCQYFLRLHMCVLMKEDLETKLRKKTCYVLMATVAIKTSLSPLSNANKQHLAVGVIKEGFVSFT